MRSFLKNGHLIILYVSDCPIFKVSMMVKFKNEHF